MDLTDSDCSTVPHSSYPAHEGTVRQVNELEGAELDFWVAKALGLPIQKDPMGFISGPEAGYWIWEDGPERRYAKIGKGFSPSTDWSQGGPIIEREKIGIYPSESVSGKWASRPDAEKHYGQPHIYGPTPLIAAMRCFVASKFGEIVDDYLCLSPGM